jgi:Pentapeptide repeats (8 copies)
VIKTTDFKQLKLAHAFAGCGQSRGDGGPLVPWARPSRNSMKWRTRPGRVLVMTDTEGNHTPSSAAPSSAGDPYRPWNRLLAGVVTLGAIAAVFAAAHALWSAPSEAQDLSGRALSQADVDGSQLQGATLAASRLDGLDLSRKHLEQALLIGASLRGTTLSNAHLQGADLSGADLRGANLTGADLSGADLRGACLQGADVARTQLRGVRIDGASYTDRQFDSAQTLPLGISPGAHASTAQPSCG